MENDHGKPVSVCVLVGSLRKASLNGMLRIRLMSLAPSSMKLEMRENHASIHSGAAGNPEPVHSGVTTGPLRGRSYARNCRSNARRTALQNWTAIARSHVSSFLTMARATSAYFASIPFERRLPQASNQHAHTHRLFHGHLQYDVSVPMRSGSASFVSFPAAIASSRRPVVPDAETAGVSSSIAAPGVTGGRMFVPYASPGI